MLDEQKNAKTNDPTPGKTCLRFGTIGTVCRCSPARWLPSKLWSKASSEQASSATGWPGVLLVEAEEIPEDLRRDVAMRRLMRSVQGTFEDVRQAQQGRSSRSPDECAGDESRSAWRTLSSPPSDHQAHDRQSLLEMEGAKARLERLLRADAAAIGSCSQKRSAPRKKQMDKTQEGVLPHEHYAGHQKETAAASGTVKNEIQEIEEKLKLQADEQGKPPRRSRTREKS